MSDIVERLRACAFDKDNFPNMRSERKLSVGDALEAADKIERLEAALRAFIGALDAGHAPPLEAYDAARAALEGEP